MRKVLTVCALAALLWSCAKEPENNTEEPGVDPPAGNVVGPVTLSASLTELIEEAVPAFAEGDQIGVFGAEKVLRKLTLSSKKNPEEAEISGPIWPYILIATA